MVLNLTTVFFCAYTCYVYDLASVSLQILQSLFQAQAICIYRICVVLKCKIHAFFCPIKLLSIFMKVSWPWPATRVMQVLRYFLVQLPVKIPVPCYHMISLEFFQKIDHLLSGFCCY